MVAEETDSDGWSEWVTVAVTEETASDNWGDWE